MPKAPNAHAQNSQDVGNIHIDRLRIIGFCHHRPIGTVALFGEAYSALAVKGATVKGAPEYYVRSRHLVGPGEAREIELHVCPPQLLTGQNVFGHSDLVGYAVACLRSVLAHEEVKLLSEPWRTWEQGRFKVTEVHLTGNFGMDRELVLPALNAIDADTRFGKHRDAETALTLGFAETRRSRYRALTLYDKWVLLRSLWPSPTPAQKELLESIRCSIRGELKLYSMQLKRLGLDQGSNWKSVDVNALFFQEFKTFGITHAIQRLLTTDEVSRLPLPTRNVYWLWLKGVSVFDQFASRSTAWKHINLIKELTCIDCSGNRRPDALPACDLADVFTAGNILCQPGNTSLRR